MDGVVVKGDSPPIRNASAVLKKILAKHGKSSKHLPFVFLTNGGMKTEQAKADKLNELLFGSKEAGLLTKDHLILAHTVLMDEKILSRYKDKFVLVESLAPSAVEIA